MTDADFERKEHDDFYVDVDRLKRLPAPQVRPLTGSDWELEYRRDASIEYLLGMVGHLLQRIELLEGKVDPLPSGVISAATDGTSVTDIGRSDG